VLPTDHAPDFPEIETVCHRSEVEGDHRDPDRQVLVHHHTLRVRPDRRENGDCLVSILKGWHALLSENPPLITQGQGLLLIRAFIAPFGAAHAAFRRIGRRCCVSGPQRPSLKHIQPRLYFLTSATISPSSGVGIAEMKGLTLWLTETPLFPKPAGSLD